MNKTIKDSFNRSIQLYHDLIKSVDSTALNSKLPKVRSNTVGLQLWCVVGARESFYRAIKANQWSGFSCSLESTTDNTMVEEALLRSGEAVIEVLRSIDTYSDVQNRLIIDVLEHEAAHQGQWIRDIYALDLTIPDSWKARFALQ